jgi:MFS family permease
MPNPFPPDSPPPQPSAGAGTLSLPPHRTFWDRSPAALRIFRHRNFRLFFFGQFISLIGTWMQSTALQWLVYSTTGSQSSLGMVTFLNFLPVLLFSLPMGVLVDRASKRNILVLTQTWFMLLAAVLAVLTFTGVIEYWMILGLAFLVGIGNALDMPARQAFYVDIADREDLNAAIGLNSAVFNGARIVGPAVAGIVVAAIGEAPAFAINALSFLAVIVALLMMHITRAQAPAAHQKGMGDLLQGLRYLLQEKMIFGLVVMVALFSFFVAPYMVLLPVFARDVLQTGAQGFGQLLAAQGVGALLGAFGLIFLGDRRKKGQGLLLSRGLLGFAIAGLALSRSPWLSMLALVVAGFAFITQLILTNSLIQNIVPDSLRGRVISAYTWALGGFFPLGSLLIGVIGDQIGAPATALLIAGISILLTLANLVLFPRMKELV